MMVGMREPGNLFDRATQAWVRWTGRKVSFAAVPWLFGPTGDQDQIDDGWLRREAEHLGGTLVEGGGLLDRMSDLRGDGFDPALLANAIVEFYEGTSDWRLDVRSKWSTAAWPFGWLLTSVFSQRLGQLNLPLRSRDTAHGIYSRIVIVQDHNGSRLGAAWLRTLRATGRTIYSGWYGTTTLPESHRPSLRVVFPLPNGNVTAFLRPEVRPDGALVLSSPIGPFGTEGVYLVVVGSDRESGWVRRVPLAEEFVVSVDDEGTLRTDHTLALWRLPVFRLHYRMTRV
jgi:hypothetical protein